MSEVQMVVRDEAGDWSGTLHGSVADLAIAALSADPVTLTELEAAAARFARPAERGRLFTHLSPGLRDEPYDAGLVVVDLAARLAVVDSTYSSPGLAGSVWYRGDGDERHIALSYHLAHDWLFLRDGDAWRAAAEARRRERAKHPPLDVRAVVYGRPLLEFVARETLASFNRFADPADAVVLPSATPADNASAQEATRDYRERVYDELKEIHAAWLLAPRDDLRGACPRETMLEHRESLAWDLQDRSEQWSLLDVCPPGLPESSFAFRFGGFGTHELVVYYELVRELLGSTWSQLEELSQAPQASHRPEALTAGDFLTTEVPRLERLRDDWLDAPNPEYHMRTPREVILRERRRLPEGISGEEAMVDPDCPCCQMMSDMPGPVFWGLDGSGMDDDFAFDIHHVTRDQWEAEQRRWQDFNRRFDAEQEERRRLGATDRAADEDAASSVWKTSFSSQENSEAPLSVRVFGVGCHLAELIADLRGDDERAETTQDVQQLIDQLNRDFGNVRELLYASEPSVAEALVDPVIDRLIETLIEAGAARPDLVPKCEALADDVRSLLEAPATPLDDGSAEFDIPF